ncbi:probable cytochrome P450 28d1 [Musca vetustissima]|uniref:probable cytochrome P450 28d1 n=1 Tax=Musca vetustissima TaxID=27455 RepID=UPI002AB6ECD1|nr:probable cytochrome P450 28d1 [Musca vetustissima]
MFIVVGAVAFFLWGIYVYLTWNFDHWRKRGVPGPIPQVLLGTFPGTVLGKRNLIYDLDNIYRQFKGQTRFVGVFMTRKPQLLLIDPQLCKDILVGNFKCFQDNESSKWMDRHKEPISGSNPFVLPSAVWKTKRTEIVQGLTHSKIKNMYPIIDSIGDRLVQYLQKMMQNDVFTIDAKEVSLLYTAEVVADIGWGIKTDNFRAKIPKENCIFFHMSKRMIAQTFRAFKYFFLMGIFPGVRHFLYVRFFPVETDRFFLNLTHSALKSRRRAPIRNDFLQHMLELQSRKGLSETEILAHQLTLHFDGFETSATLLSHCLLLLARNPDKQQILRTEIQEHMVANRNILAFNDLMKLPYLDQCVSETLRIFTPLPFMTKLCTETCSFRNADGVNLILRPGDVCIISLYSIHHDPEYYLQPEEFWPERFSDVYGGTKPFKDTSIYMPFGDGPRICLGMTFGLAQTKAAIAKLILNFELTSSEETRKDNYQSAHGFIIGLDGGIFLNLKQF